MNIKTPSSNNIDKDKHREYWLLHVQQWKQSNLKQKAYCRQAGINYSSFTYWRRILQSELPQAKQQQFVPVKVTTTKELVSAASQVIQVKLATGHVVYIPATMEIEAIASLIHLLGVPHA